MFRQVLRLRSKSSCLMEMLVDIQRKLPQVEGHIERHIGDSRKQGNTANLIKEATEHETNQTGNKETLTVSVD